MPTYEYLCSDCQHQWEEIQKISEDPIKVCPNCAKSAAKRQISGGSFILKGGGWYADLYSSSGNSSAKKGSDGEAKASTDTAAKTETKTETKTESKPSSDASSSSSSSKAETKSST